MTASSRINSHTVSSRNGETRSETTVEEGELLVSELNLDRQTHAHYKISRKKSKKTGKS